IARIAVVLNDLFPSFTAMPRTIGVLIFPRFQLLDVAGPITVFEAAGRERKAGPPNYRLRVMAHGGGPVASSSGVQLIAEPLIEERLDTLLVAGGWGTRRASIPPDPFAYVRAPPA